MTIKLIFKKLSLFIFVVLMQVKLSYSDQVDLDTLAKKIQISARGQDIEQVRLRLLKRFQQDREASNTLKTYLILNAKKTSENSPLLKNLNKMLNIYDDAIDLINTDKTIHYNFNKVKLLDHQSGLAEIIAVSTLLTARNLKNLSGDKAADIRIDLKIDTSNEMFDDLPMVSKLASKISLINGSVKGKLALWIPFIMFGSNNPK
jgi:hypothetical protein